MSWLGYNEALQELRSDSEIIVGTGAQATWRLRRADLMPRHFVVSIAGDRATIRPFSREAVVTVNGRQVPPGDSELHDGDLISAGSGDFLFFVDLQSKKAYLGQKVLRLRISGKDEILCTLDIHFKHIDSRQYASGPRITAAWLRVSSTSGWDSTRRGFIGSVSSTVSPFAQVR